MTLDLVALWDFNRPELSEERFRAALQTASSADALILKTQIARTHGLRGDFDHARTVLSEIESQVMQIGGEPAVRYWLELGRTYSSAAHTPETQTDAVRAQARYAYEQALSLAQENTLDALAIDTLHMLALVEETTEQQLHWNRTALALAEKSLQPAARKWTASLHNNLGYTLHQLGRYDEALSHFELALAVRQEDGNADNIRIAHWMIAWTYRSMDRLSEALAIQLRLEAEWEADGQPDPYVFEELAALYQSLGNADRAKHYATLSAQSRSELRKEEPHMADRSVNVLRYGVDAPLPEERTLRAGPVTVLYSAGDLRAIRLGDHEILNRVYVAVRDRNWNTIPLVLSNVQIEDNGDSFHIAYAADHRQDDIDFHWQGTIHGAPDGTITFGMDGAARSTFLRNRIGFCVLHPAHVAGASCTVEHVDGTIEESQFPQHISPDQPIFDIRAIRHTVQDGVSAPIALEVRMEGDTFEMEDQRNWTDASFKTYCTPLGLPFPAQITAGTPVTQQITLRLHGEAPAQESSDAGAVELRIEQRTVGQMPRIGLGLSSQETVLERQEIERLRAMHLSHLRVDVDFARDNWQDELRRAVDEADAIGARLEIALHLSNEADTELATLRKMVQDLRPAVQHWLIYHKATEGIDAQWIDLARRHLGDYDRVDFGAGTNAYFTELNRERPPAAVLDLICYSINPQVHAFDNRSLMETLPVQATTVESARVFAAGRPIAVTPITLQPRFNPNATSSADEEDADELPSQVDVRQMSLFGAAWTVGSLKAMAESSVHSVTYYETVGWRGVMESITGSPLPERFRSQPGEVFPLYHVLADVARCAGAPVLFAESSAADKVTGFAFQRDGQIRLLVANLTNEAQEVAIHHGGNRVHVRMIDEHNVRAAMSTPEAYRNEERSPVNPAHGQTSLRLTSYAVAMMEISG